jgi:hypothetical protein
MSSVAFAVFPRERIAVLSPKDYFIIFILSKKKVGKVIPFQAYGAQRVLGRLRLPDSVASALEGGRLSAIRTGRLYPQEYPVTHFKRLSQPRAHGIVGCHGKNSPVTPPGIDPGTFRLVGQCLNHYATTRTFILSTARKKSVMSGLFQI